MTRTPYRLRPVGWLLVLLALAGFPGCDGSLSPPGYTNPYDAEAPGGPAQLDAPAAPSLERATPTTATLVWEDRSQIEDEYVVERAISPASSGDQAVFVPLARLPANTTRFTDTTATGLGPYLYRLRSVRGSLQSPPGPVLRTVWPGLTAKRFGAQSNCLSGLTAGVCTVYGVPHRISFPDGLRLANLGGETGRLSLNASRTRLLVASQRYATPSDRYAYTVYNLSTGQQEAQYVTPNLRFFFGETVPMGFFVGEDEVLLFTGQQENRLFELWQPSTGQLRPAPAFGPLTMAAAATGTAFVFSANTVVALDAHTGERRWTAPAQFFHLSPAGRYAFLVGVNGIEVVNSASGAHLATLSGQVSFENPLPVQQEAFFNGAAEDRPLVALTNTRGSLSLVDWQTKRLVRFLQGSNDPLRWDVGAFLPDGNVLLIRNYTQYVHLDLSAVWTAVP